MANFLKAEGYRSKDGVTPDPDPSGARIMDISKWGFRTSEPTRIIRQPERFGRKRRSFRSAQPVLRSLLFVSVFVLSLYCLNLKVMGAGHCISSAVVRSVGGCDVLGNCGVEFTNGNFASAYKPVPNQVVCTDRSAFIRKGKGSL